MTIGNLTTNDSQHFGVLLLRAQSGDREAQGELLEPLREFLQLLASRQLDARLSGRVDASDIVHETYITALGSLDQFRGSERLEFIAWLRSVHEHVVQKMTRDHIITKKRSVNRERPFAENQLLPWSLLTDSTPSRNLMQAEVILQLIHVLDALPADQREAIRLRYFDGWKLEKIADHMQRSLPSVAGLLKRGLKSLRAKLAPAHTESLDLTPPSEETSP